MWYGLREWLKAGGCLPHGGADAERLASELSSPVYWYDAAGKIVLEPKDKIRERLGASPDIADALALTLAAPVDAAPRGRSLAQSDFDVLAWEGEGYARRETARADDGVLELTA